MRTRESINYHWYIFLIAFLIFSGCVDGHKKSIAVKSRDVQDEVVRAERLSIEKKTGFTQVRIINPWQGANGVKQIYNLVKSGSELPAGLDSAAVIFVPLKKIICMSTTYIAMISALGEEKTLQVYQVQITFIHPN